MKRAGGLLRDMVIFAKLVETKSFSEAARALGLPKSTVSRRIEALEESLGVRLVLRNNRGLQVTTIGREYHRRARRVLELAEEATQAVLGKERLHGEVRLTAPRAVGALLVAEVLSAFLREHPGVMAELVLTDRRVDLSEERFDLAIRTDRNIMAPPGFSAELLSPTWILLCASPAYIERHGAPAEPADLARHDAVIVRFLGGKRWRLRGLEGVIDIDVAGRIVVDDVTMAERAVRAGLGIAPVVAAIAAPLVRAGELVHVLPSWTFEVRSLLALFVAEAHRPARTQRLIEHLVPQLRAAIEERLGALRPPVPDVEHDVPSLQASTPR